MPAVNPAMVSTADDDKPSFPVMNLYARGVSLGISLVECRICVSSLFLLVSVRMSPLGVPNFLYSRV